MADDSLEAQLQRLAAIVAPLAETVNQHDARMARYDAMHADHVARMAVLEAIVARLDRLIADVFRDRQDGRNT